ncbi:MAG: hypothetical protein ACT4PO_14590 [Actinomycetota bacterium]
MHARLTIATGPAERAKEARQLINDQAVPGVKQISGLSGAYFLQDESTGKVVALTLFETEADLVASREAAQRIRDATTSALGATVQSLEEFEVIASV